MDGMHEYILTNRGVELVKAAGWCDDDASNMGIQGEFIGMFVDLSFFCV